MPEIDEDAHNNWWLPGLLIGMLAMIVLIGGLISDGPDVVGGIIFGGVLFAAAGVTLWRRAPKSPK